MIDSIPASSCAIVVTNTDAVATCFLGLIIHGDKGILKAIEKKASAIGLRTQRVASADPGLETMVFFEPPLLRVDVMGFYHTLLLQQTPGLKIELMVSPSAKAEDGIDLDNEVEAVPPEYIREPSS